MKKIMILGSLVLSMASCSDALIDDQNYNYSDGEGGVSIAIETKVETKAGSSLSGSSLEQFENSILNIYNSNDAVIRKYEPATASPATIFLVSGDYSLSLDFGSGVEMTTDSQDLTYYGESDFTITSGLTTAVGVTCNVVNTVVGIDFDETTLDKYLEAGYKVTLTTESIADKSLNFTEDGDGYFILPDDAKTIAWQFEGVRKSDSSAVSVSGVISEANAGEKNVLTFQYDYVGQYLDFVGGITVDTSVEEFKDNFDFVYEGDDEPVEPSKPTISEDFDSTDIPSADGDAKFAYNISSETNLTDIDIDVNGETVSPLKNGELQSVEGASFVPTDDMTKAGAGYKSGVLTIEGSLFKKFETAGENTIDINITDEVGTTTKSLTAVTTETPTTPEEITGTIDNVATDLWKNSATITTSLSSDNFTKATMQVREANATAWQTVDLVASGDSYVANVGATWSTQTNDAGLTYYTPSNGIWAGTSYECQLIVDDKVVASTTFGSASNGVQTIPDGNLDNKDLKCYSTGNGGSSWDSGNNSFTSSLCKQATVDGATCAKLTTSESVGIIAAGNIFYGGFKFNGLFSKPSLTGFVSFGQAFTWTSRPRSLKVKYAASLAKGEIEDPNGNKLTQDRGRIFLAIVDWSAQHVVSAGSSDAATGVWDPTTQNEVGEVGNIIGYASMFIDQSTSLDELTQLELPIYYYDKTTKPSKKYSLVISCASSAYGDYKIGVKGSTLYVDDFEFGY